MAEFKSMKEFRAALNGLVRQTASQNGTIPWSRAYNNPRFANWTSDPTYSYEQFYRANPGKVRGKLTPRDPQRFTVFPVEGYAGTRWKVGPGPARYEYAFRTRAEAEQRARKMREAEEAEDAAIGQASRSGRFGLPPHSSLRAAQVRRYDEPLLADIERVEGGSYEPVEILRLLDRADSKSLPYVERMLDRMLERQTVDERRARDAKYMNFQGFNSPDSSKAEKIRLRLSELKRATNPGEELIRLHYKLSLMLSKYANRQLLDVMNRGAAEHGVAVRTNPAGVMERAIRGSSARDLQDFVVLAQRESLRWSRGEDFGGADPVLAEEWAWRLGIARDELDRRMEKKSAVPAKPRVRPTRSNPGKSPVRGFPKTSRSEAEGLYVFPKRKSFPIGDLYHAKMAVEWATTWPSLKQFHGEVLQAVEGAYPDYDWKAYSQQLARRQAAKEAGYKMTGKEREANPIVTCPQCGKITRDRMLFGSGCLYCAGQEDLDETIARRKLLENPFSR